EQRVDAREVMEAVLPELLHEPGEIARVRDQHAFAALCSHAEAVTLQREDVVERQRRDHHDALYALEDVALPGLRLRDVEHDVAMAQHRAFRRTGRAAGVLEEREIGVAELDRLERMAAPALQ